jgi:hypothetical protein
MEAFCRFLLRLIGARQEYVALALKLMSIRDKQQNGALLGSAAWIKYGATSALGQLMLNA